MALVPISFKADVSGGQKGNVRAEDLSALFAFCYPDSAGILNISGQDCSVNGTPTIVGSSAQVTFRKGYINIYGRLIYVEEGTQVAFTLPSSATSGILGVKINLSETGANEVTWFQKTTNAQTDDLLANSTSGVYEFVLYNYTATSTTFVIGSKTTQIINNIKDNIKFATKPTADNSTSPANTEFVKNVLNAYKPLINKATDGSIKLENGLIIKWGWSDSIDRTNTKQFDPTYPFSTIYSIIVTPDNRQYTSATIAINNGAFLIGYDTTSFTYKVGDSRIKCFYIAIGV